MSNTISVEQVKELRDATGVSVMQCRKALEEAGGDMEKALLVLKKKSSDIAAKKADREAKDGVVIIKKNTNKAAVIILNCETDFVAKNEDFLAVANSLAETALTDGVEKTKEIATEKINLIVQKIGENIQLGTVETYEGSPIGVYTHNTKLSVMCILSEGTEELARDVAMHAAAMKPAFVSKDDVPAATREQVREMFAKEVAESGKPAEIQEKMLASKIDTYFKEQTLLEQPFVKDPSKTVGALLGSAKVSQLTRFAI
jgi:elongation factor Ts